MADGFSALRLRRLLARALRARGTWAQPNALPTSHAATTIRTGCRRGAFTHAWVQRTDNADVIVVLLKSEGPWLLFGKIPALCVVGMDWRSPTQHPRGAKLGQHVDRGPNRHL